MRSDAAERRERIIIEASYELVEKGKNFSLEKVAKNAEVGVATLYRNFPTRNSLIIECILRISDSVCDQLDETAAQVGAQEETTQGSLWEMLQHLVPAGINILVPAIFEPAEEQLSDALIEKKRRFQKSMGNIMDVARKHGFIHETVPDNWVINGLIQLYQPNAYDFTGDPFNPASRNHLVAVFLEGCERGINESVWFTERNRED